MIVYRHWQRVRQYNANSIMENGEWKMENGEFLKI